MAAAEDTCEACGLPLASTFRASRSRDAVLACTDDLRQALSPIDALLVLAADGLADAEALDDAREGMRRALAAVERLERGMDEEDGGTP